LKDELFRGSIYCVMVGDRSMSQLNTSMVENYRNSFLREVEANVEGGVMPGNIHPRNYS